MGLNFNSVEMSFKPNAEPSSLGYAEVPLTFNSVETIANLNASAAVKKEHQEENPSWIEKAPQNERFFVAGRTWFKKSDYLCN